MVSPHVGRVVYLLFRDDVRDFLLLRSGARSESLVSCQNLGTNRLRQLNEKHYERRMCQEGKLVVGGKNVCLVEALATYVGCCRVDMERVRYENPQNPKPADIQDPCGRLSEETSYVLNHWISSALVQTRDPVGRSKSLRLGTQSVTVARVLAGGVMTLTRVISVG